MKIIIRKFRAGDAIKVGNLARRANCITQRGHYSPAVLEALCRGTNKQGFLQMAREREIYVAELPGRKRICGVIGILDNRLRNFFVDSAFQGLGVGRLLFEHFKKKMLERKIRTVVVCSSLYAVPIYKKFGFKTVREINPEIHGQKVPMVVMNLKLKEAN